MFTKSPWGYTPSLTGLWVHVEVLGDKRCGEEALTELGLPPPPVLVSIIQQSDDLPCEGGEGGGGGGEEGGVNHKMPQEPHT